MEKANLGLILLLKSNSAVFTVGNTVEKLLIEIIFLLLQALLVLRHQQLYCRQRAVIRIIKDGGIFGLLVPLQARCA